MEEEVLDFEYAVYALGSHLPSPINPWGPRDSDLSFKAQELVCSDLESVPQSANHARTYTGMKQEGVSWARSCQRRIEAARQVLVVGGGALGIRKPFFIHCTNDFHITLPLFFFRRQCFAKNDV